MLRSSAEAPPKPILHLLLGALGVTRDPVLPSTAEINERVSRPLTISRNSVLVSGCSFCSLLHMTVYVSKSSFTVGAVL